MNSLLINFYEEEIEIFAPESLFELKQVISQRFFLEMQDVDELIFYTFKKEVKKMIKTEEQYKKILELSKHGNIKIFIELSENSRLFQKEMENYSKLSMNQTWKFNRSEVSEVTEVMNESITMKSSGLKESLLMEIREKEKQLKELLEKEKEEQQRIEEERRRKEVEEARARKIIEDKLKQDQEQKEIEERIRIEEMRRKKEEEEKEKLKETLTRSVIETINQNIEKCKEEMINKTLEEVNKTIEHMNIESSILMEKKNMTVHHGYTCDGCDTYPIIGCRYKCTVCHDFDFCEDCEKKNGYEHRHPLIKHREEFTFPQRRFLNRCRRFENEGDYQNSGFLKYLEDKVKYVKEFFQKSADEIVSKTTEGSINLKEDINEDTTKNEEVTTTTTEERERYKNMLMDMRCKFFFGDLTDDQLLEALVQTKGNLDQALELLLC
jgi:hypothetical protein